jgi:uncharacterized protein (DUF2267 family)
VQYDDFRLVRAGPQRPPPRRDRDARPRDVARVLAEPLTAGEANDLRAQLPGALQGDLIPTEPEAQPSAPDEFADRVARMGRLPEKEARNGMVAVLATTRDAVEPGEFDDVLAQLGGEFGRLVPGPS